jgi:glycosyltransferase involved in cell wall biosynthesis
MKIAYDYTAFLLQKYGGVTKYFVELVKNISLNHDVKIIAPININIYATELEKEIFSLIRLKKIPRFGSKISNYLNYIISSIHMKYSKPDIIHKTFFNNYSYKNQSAKKILNVWDLNHEIYHDLYKKNKEWRPKKIALSQADHVICSSNKTQSDLVKYYNFDLEKTSVVYQGINKYENHHDIQYNKQKYLLYVGSRLKYKNFDNLLKALSINKQILEDFKLICFGEEKINSLEKELIKKLNLNEKNILFISGNDFMLREYYLKSTALIYPSKNEGFGFPPLEAMSFGCPVITSNNSAIIEATNLLDYSFDPNSPNDIALKIENIIYSKTIINHLISHGLERIKELSWKHTTSNILDVYKKILN